MPMRVATTLRTATETSTPARTTSKPSTPESLAPSGNSDGTAPPSL
jgi:hypothetical protein